MLVIYDLDKTTCFCPLADFADKFIPPNKFLKKFYYKLYPFIHRFEMKFDLFKTNLSFYQRARLYSTFPGVTQVIITARHYTPMVDRHKEAIFGSLDIPVVCIAQGLSELFKADVVSMLPIEPDEEIIMFDDNLEELTLMHIKFGKRFTGYKVLFKGKEEQLEHVY